MAHEERGVMQYSKEELKEIIENGTAEVIDVRTPEEYEEGHIPSIPLKPMQEIAEWASELDPEKPYVFVCRSGGRSSRVAEALVAHGFRNIGNYVGGMLAWDGDLKEGSDA